MTFFLFSETSSLYLKQRFDIEDTWHGYSEKEKMKKRETDDIIYQISEEKQKVIEKEDNDMAKAIPAFEMSNDTQSKKKTKKHRKKKYKEIDSKVSSIENLTEGKSFGDENSEATDVKKEWCEREKHDKEQISSKSDEGELKKHRKRKKKHAKSHGDEEQIAESDVAFQSSEISIRKETKRKKKRNKKSKERKGKHNEPSDAQPMIASFLESASSETLRKRSKEKEQAHEIQSDDERFLEGVDSPLMSLTDISSEEDKPHKKGIFRRLFKW